MKKKHGNVNRRVSSRAVAVLSAAVLLMMLSTQAEAGLFRRSVRKAEAVVEEDFVPESSGCYRQRVAVCVGINRYESHPKLNYAENDAAEMAGVLRDFGFDEVELLLGPEATREAILVAVQRISARVKSDDLFVFYFAGHGMTIRQNGDLTGVLVPVDCGRGRESSEGISMAFFKDLTGRMESRHNLFLMDACYSGLGLSEGMDISGRGERATPLAAQYKIGNPCVQVLTAGGELDRAFESDGHGLFTGYLLESLKAVARKGNGAISGRRLASVVSRKVSDHTGGWQKPQFGHAGSGEVFLVKRDANLSGALAMAN